MGKKDWVSVCRFVAPREDSIGDVAQEQIASLASDVGDGAHHLVAPLLLPRCGVLINPFGNGESLVIGPNLSLTPINIRRVIKERRQILRCGGAGGIDRAAIIPSTAAHPHAIAFNRLEQGLRLRRPEHYPKAGAQNRPISAKASL